VRRVFIAPTGKLLFPEVEIETVASQPVLGETSVRERPSVTGDAPAPSGGVSAKRELEIGTEAVTLDPEWSSQFRLSLPTVSGKRPVWDQEFKLFPKGAEIDKLLQRVDKYREQKSVDFSKYQPSNYYSTITGAGSRNRAGSTLRAGLGSRISLKEVNYDLSPWADKVLAKIQKTWLISSEQLSQAVGQVEILVMVNRSGTVESVKIIQASHASLLDGTALKALELSSPFPNLPYNFPEDRLEIRLVFLTR
jgi:TonB family protein